MTNILVLQQLYDPAEDALDRVHRWAGHDNHRHISLYK